MPECRGCCKEFVELKLFLWEYGMYCDDCYRNEKRSDGGKYASMQQRQRLVGKLDWINYLHDSLTILLPYEASQ